MKDELKTTTIKDALGYPDSTPIQRITGRVKLVWNRTEGEGKYGPWTKQAGIMEDGADQILFTVWNKPNIEDFKGRNIIFRSSGGKKPCITIAPDFKDNTKRTLNVTKSCLVLTEEEESDDIPFDDPTPKHDIKGFVASVEKVVAMESKTAPKPATATKKAIPEDGVDQVKHRVMQYINLRSITDAAVKALYADGSMYGQEYVDDVISTVSSCLFIQGCKDGLLEKLPNNKPIAKSKTVQTEVEPESFPDTYPEKHF